MAKEEPFKAFRITTRILSKLYEKKAALARQDSMTAFIGWILDLYAEDKLEEATVLRAKIEAKMLPEIEAKVRSEMERVGRVATAAGAERLRKHDEQRKAS